MSLMTTQPLWLGLTGILFLVCVSVGADAQTVTGSGTSGTVPVFTASSTIGNSPIAVSGTNVGIGTTSAQGGLDVSPGFGASSWIYLRGNLNGQAPNPSTTVNYGLMYGWNASGGLGDTELLYGTGLGTAPRLDFGRWSGAAKTIDMTLSGGNLGIGTTAPAYSLDVSGKIRSTSGVVYPDSTQQTTAWTGVLCGGDYAEAMDVVGGKAKYEPGDVLVLSSEDTSDVEKSSKVYSTMVAGIYATKPGVVGRRESLAKSSDDIPMAMIGVVPTKVSAENGPIHKGDLLVTSSLPGYAMKGTDHNRLVGAVIGKAMGSLDSGRGVIEVLVTLQ